tara:strand:+ start:12754 stop:13704 length:951 start_codon:yes stop_codon:yes gene_type:complete
MECDFSDKILAAKRSGPKSGAQTPAKPSERKKGSSKNKPGTAGKGGDKITFSEKVITALKNKVKEHNGKHSKKVTLSQLKKVYRRGAGAFSSSHRPGKTRGQWAMARVNMFLKMMRGGKVKDSYRKADQDIANASDICISEHGEFEPTVEDLITAKLELEKLGLAAEDPMAHMFETEEEAEEEAEKMGLTGTHPHRMEDGKVMYMPGKDHETFMKRHEEILKSKAAKEKKLNKPFRTPDGPKKFAVYVKNEKGNVIKVNFGDPNMEIKRDDPDRRKNFRARHNCDDPGPKWKARYWSCKFWESGKSVTDYLKGDED